MADYFLEGDEQRRYGRVQISSNRDDASAKQDARFAIETSLNILALVDLDDNGDDLPSAGREAAERRASECVEQGERLERVSARSRGLAESARRIGSAELDAADAMTTRSWNRLFSWRSDKQTQRWIDDSECQSWLIDEYRRFCSASHSFMGALNPSPLVFMHTGFVNLSPLAFMLAVFLNASPVEIIPSSRVAPLLQRMTSSTTTSICSGL